MLCPEESLLCLKEGFGFEERHALTLQANGEQYDDLLKYHIASMELVASLVPSKSADADTTTSTGDDLDQVRASET